MLRRAFLKLCALAAVPWGRSNDRRETIGVLDGPVPSDRMDHSGDALPYATAWQDFARLMGKRPDLLRQFNALDSRDLVNTYRVRKPHA